MNKWVIALIVAAVLLVSGGLMIFLGLKNVDFDFSKKVSEKTYVVSESFQNIQIDSDICDIVFKKTDGEFRVVCPDSEKVSCAVIVEDSTLKITVKDVRQWTDLIGVFPAEMQVTVYLPESRYEELKIETNTGDITVPNDFSFTCAEMAATTASIDFYAAVEKLLTATVTTGDVTVYGSSPAVMRITVTTGDIVLEEITGNCEFALNATSGDVQAQNVACEVMHCKTTTGSVSFYRVIAQGYLGVNCTTGSILLEDCDSAEVNIKTTTGDVKGHFLNPKYFITDTTTGDVDVPHSREGGECRVTTTTGSIRFR